MTNISEQIIADLLLEQTGQELTDSRRWRIGSALSGLFRERGLDNLEQLVVLLSEQRNDVLAKETVDALLNNETYFFRDKPLFEQLENEVLPRIAKQNENRKRISIWSAGCSTGQEALTLAMMFANQTMRWKGWQTDVSPAPSISHPSGRIASARRSNARRRVSAQKYSSTFRHRTRSKRSARVIGSRILCCWKVIILRIARSGCHPCEVSSK